MHVDDGVIFTGGGTATAFHAAVLVDVCIAASVDDYSLSGADFPAVMSYAASADIGDHVTGLGTFIAGDGYHLDRILGSVEFAETYSHAFSDDGSVLIDAAAHGRFASLSHYVCYFIKGRKGVVTLPGMAGHFP